MGSWRSAATQFAPDAIRQPSQVGLAQPPRTGETSDTGDEGDGHRF
jgi:hypothetical protein